MGGSSGKEGLQESRAGDAGPRPLGGGRGQRQNRRVLCENNKKKGQTGGRLGDGRDGEVVVVKATNGSFLCVLRSRSSAAAGGPSANPPLRSARQSKAGMAGSWASLSREMERSAQ